MKYQEIDHSLSRAFEIALAGGHTIGLIGNVTLKQYMDDLKALLPEVRFAPIGNADILLEITLPTPDYAKAAKNREGKDDVIKRTLDLKPVPPELSPVCETLLKTAYSKLSLTPIDRDKVILLAQTIASLGGSLKIEAQHLAEAIHYRVIQDDLNNPDTEVLVRIPEGATGSFDNVIEVNGKFYRQLTLDLIYI